MTKLELEEVIDILSDCVKTEKRYAERYIEQNPDDAEDRNRLMDASCISLFVAQQTIRERFKRRVS